jgi:hypothetical protein
VGNLNLKILIIVIFLVLITITLQEALVFSDGNETIHSFLNTGTLFKCEGGLFNLNQ